VNKSIKIFPRVIFILTDGSVGDKNRTIDIVKKNSEYCYVHVLGISDGVDRDLVTQLATAGNGHKEFVLNARKIKEVTMKLLNQSMIPTYRDINLVLPEGFKQIPQVSTYVRKGQRLLMFAVPTTSNKEHMDSIMIRGTSPTGDPFETLVPINHNIELKGDTIKKFSAFARIKELEMFKSTLSPEKIKEEIVSLGLENKIVTIHTSLIAIDMEGDNVIQRSMDLVKIDTLEDQGSQRGGVKKEKKKKGKVSDKLMMRSKSKKSKKESPQVLNNSGDSKTGVYLESSGDEDDEMEGGEGNVGPNLSMKKGVSDADIIGKQKSNGSWLLSDLILLLSWDSGKVEGANPCSDIIIWTTALALCYLEKKFSNSKELWEMVAKKAITFIRKECRSQNFSYESIIQQGNKFIDEL